MNPWILAIGSVVVAVAELQCPGYYLIWIAAGGAITALASFAFDLSLSAQISIFIVSCSLSCIWGYFVYQRMIRSSEGNPPLNQRNLEMVGAKGVVTQALENGQGKVKLGDSVWLAEGPNLKTGTPVIVKEVRGTVVLVAKH
jgi:membrane protein implicated in regulation of membrane protease activity